MGGRGSRGRALPQVGFENGYTGPQPSTERVDRAGAPAERIRAAYEKVIEGREEGDHVSLASVRAALPKDLTRAEVDAALLELFDDPHVSFIPESNQKTLTSEHRDAAIVVGNQDLHLIGIRKPIDLGARDRINTGGISNATDADLDMAQRDPATRSAQYDEIRAEVRRRKATPPSEAIG